LTLTVGATEHAIETIQKRDDDALASDRARRAVELAKMLRRHVRAARFCYVLGGFFLLFSDGPLRRPGDDEDDRSVFD
jgi:hypothetical protein